MLGILALLLGKLKVSGLMMQLVPAKRSIAIYLPVPPGKDEHIAQPEKGGAAQQIAAFEFVWQCGEQED